MDLSEFRKTPALGILRTKGNVPVEDLIECVISSGLRTMEIAMNSDNATGIIRRALRVARGRISIGAGTVIDMVTLKTALDSGATFIVSPTLVDDVMEYCVKHSIPAFPGAMTPLEICNAWKSGAAMVKVFPSSVLGPGYFKEIKGPFADIELLACGGITTDNIRSYFSSGASAIAFGGSVFRKDLIDAGRFSAIETLIKDLLSRINQAVSP